MGNSQHALGASRSLPPCRDVKKIWKIDANALRALGRWELTIRRDVARLGVDLFDLLVSLDGIIKSFRDEDICRKLKVSAGHLWGVYSRSLEKEKRGDVDPAARLALIQETLSVFGNLLVETSKRMQCCAPSSTDCLRDLQGFLTEGKKLIKKYDTVVYNARDIFEYYTGRFPSEKVPEGFQDARYESVVPFTE